MKRTLIQNGLQIKSTGEIFQSAHRHDFVEIPGYGFIDGGIDYIHSSIMNLDGLNDLCLYEDSPIKDLREKLLWGNRGKDGKSPLKYTFVKDCDLDHLKAIIKYSKDKNYPLHPLRQGVIMYWIRKKTKENKNVK